MKNETNFDRSLKILLFEANRDDRSQIEEMLKQSPGLPSKIDAYTRLGEFLENAGDELSHDIILLNPNLPDSKGIGTYSKISSLYPAIPILIISDEENLDVPQKAVAQGAEDFIEKHSIEASSLKRIISHAVIRQHYRHNIVAKTGQIQMAARIAKLGVWEVDFSPMKITWSDELCKIHGLSPGHIPDLEEAITFYIPEHRSEVEEAFRKCAEDGTPFSHQWEMITAQGKHIWVRVLGEAIRDESGRIRKVHGTLQDITEVYQDQRELTILRECIRHLTDSVIICEANPTDQTESRILYVNRSFESLTGYSAAEVIGKTPRILHGPETDRTTLNLIRSSLEKNLPIRCELVNYTKQKRPYWIEIEISPIRDTTGEVRHFVGVQRDITARKEIQNTVSFQAKLLDGIGQSVITTDSKGTVIYVNKTAEKFFGRSREEMLGEQISEVTVTDEDRPLARKIVEGVQRGDDWRGEITAMHSSGTSRPILASLTGIYDETGKLEKMIGFSADISEQKEMEKALRKSLKDNLDLKEALDRHVIVSITKPDREITFVNEKFCELTGYSPEELIGQEHAILNSDYHPHSFFDEMYEKLASGQAWQGEIRNKRKNGEIFWVETTAVPLFSEDGIPEKYLYLRSDITDRKKAEEDTKFQASLLDLAHDSILVFDTDYTIEYWNKSAEILFGWKSEEALGENSLTLLKGDDVEFDQAMAAVLANGEWNGELKQTSRAGKEISTEVSWTRIASNVDNSIKILSIGLDISERRELERQFYRSQRSESLGKIAGGIAHDLNNMLTPISMVIDAMKEESGQKLDESLLEILETSTKRASELVRQVLLFSRGVEGKRQSVEIDLILQEIRSMAKETFPKNISINIECESGAPLIVADRTQIHQVMMNLCVNARDAMPEGGKLSIHAYDRTFSAEEAKLYPEAEQGEYLVISIRDTGSGIPTEIIDQIFDPFFTTKEIGKGSGIGLSTCLNIVKSHKGFIHVDSNPGRGTEFRLYLPGAPAATQHAEVPKRVKELPRGSNELILIVDDEVAIRTMAKRTFERFGYRTLVARHGAEAIAIYAKNEAEIDLVITDMAMPVMDGSTLIHALKAIEAKASIIATSGHAAGDEYIGRGREAVEHFISKPHTVDALLRTTANILEERKRDKTLV